MTATKADPFAFWNPGPLLTSATSPQPIMPKRTVRRIDIVIVDTTPGRRVRERRRVELPGGRPPVLFWNTFCRIPVNRTHMPKKKSRKLVVIVFLLVIVVGAGVYS